MSTFDRLDLSAKMLVAVNARALKSGVPVFAGVDPEERRRRRAAGKRQRAARKAGRR